jgi:uncharacterized membrane protein
VTLQENGKSRQGGGPSTDPGTHEAETPVDSRADAVRDVSEPDRILHGIFNLFPAREIEPETEEEIETRRELNQVVHRMLILGLVLSTTTLFVGLALSAISHHRLPTKVLEFEEIFRGLKTGSPPSFLSLGILLLIATPVLRVFGSLAEFIGKKDWRFAIITSVVLIILAVSVIAGKG